MPSWEIWRDLREKSRAGRFKQVRQTLPLKTPLFFLHVFIQNDLVEQKSMGRICADVILTCESQH